MLKFTNLERWRELSANLEMWGLRMVWKTREGGWGEEIVLQWAPVGVGEKLRNTYFHLFFFRSVGVRCVGHRHAPSCTQHVQCVQEVSDYVIIFLISQHIGNTFKTCLGYVRDTSRSRTHLEKVKKLDHSLD